VLAIRIEGHACAHARTDPALGTVDLAEHNEGSDMRMIAKVVIKV
jgi:hypothetical protein